MKMPECGIVSVRVSGRLTPVLEEIARTSILSGSSVASRSASSTFTKKLSPTCASLRSAENVLSERPSEASETSFSVRFMTGCPSSERTVMSMRSEPVTQRSGGASSGISMLGSIGPSDSWMSPLNVPAACASFGDWSPAVRRNGASPPPSLSGTVTLSGSRPSAAALAISLCATASTITLEHA